MQRLHTCPILDISKFENVKIIAKQNSDHISNGLEKGAI